MIWLVSKTLSYGLLPNCVKPFNRLWISDFGLERVAKSAADVGATLCGCPYVTSIFTASQLRERQIGRGGRPWERTLPACLGCLTPCTQDACALPGGVPNSTITFSELSHYPKSEIGNPKSAIRNLKSSHFGISFASFALRSLPLTGFH